MQIGGSLSVLLVEDNVEYARLIQELLRKHAASRLAWVESLAAALARLAELTMALLAAIRGGR